MVSFGSTNIMGRTGDDNDDHTLTNRWYDSRYSSYSSSLALNGFGDPNSGTASPSHSCGSTAALFRPSARKSPQHASASLQSTRR